MLVAALEARDAHSRDARAAMAEGRPEAALRHAHRCHELEPGPDSRRLIAVCLLLRGDWPGALEAGRAAGAAVLQSLASGD